MRWLTGVMLLSQAARAGAQQPAQHQPRSTQQAVTAVRRATVTISVTRADSEGVGSGFVITPDGVIATAAHVIRGAIKASVRLGGGDVYDVEGVVAIDEARDFALLRIAGFGLPIVELGNSDSVEAGQRLFAFGAPLGLEATVSDGLLSSVRLDAGKRLFQISVPVSPGSSGGPVALENGKVIGIVVSGIEGGGAQNLNFAVPINYLRGQIPLASSKLPVPLGQMSCQPRSASGEAGAAALGTRGGAPARVNDSLGIDWKVLDSVQVRAETKGDQGARWTSVAEYALSRTPQGDLTLERTTNERIWQTGAIFSGRHGGTWYEDNTRTVIELGSSHLEFYWRRSPATNQIPPAAVTLTIDDGMLVVDSGSIHRTAVLPRGALPAALLSAVIAVLPDSLPSSVYVWFFNPSSTSIRAEPVRINFAHSTRVIVQLARPGTQCSMNELEENTESVTVDAIQMTATVGPDRLSWPVLAQRPHVRLDVKCLRMPTLARQKD